MSRTIIVCIILFAARPLPGATLDQSYTADIGEFGAPVMAQTFRAGLTGELTQIDLKIRWEAMSGGLDPIVSIYAADFPAPNLPIGPSLGDLIVPRASIPGPPIPAADWVSLDLSALDIHVTAGQAYAIVLDDADLVVRWTIGPPEPGDYFFGHWLLPTSGGSWAEPFSLDGTRDFDFRTFVEVPEPGSAALMLIAVAVVLAFNRDYCFCPWPSSSRR